MTALTVRLPDEKHRRLSITESSETTGNSGNKKKKNYTRAAMKCRHADRGKDAGTNNCSDAHESKITYTQHFAHLMFM